MTAKQYFSVIYKTVNHEFDQFKDYMDGKRGFPKTYLYIRYPYIFNRSIKALGAAFWSELEPFDREWTRNARDLIDSYHRVAVDTIAKEVQ